MCSPGHINLLLDNGGLADTDKKLLERARLHSDGFISSAKRKSILSERSEPGIWVGMGHPSHMPGCSRPPRTDGPWVQAPGTLTSGRPPQIPTPSRRPAPGKHGRDALTAVVCLARRGAAPTPLHHSGGPPGRPACLPAPTPSPAPAPPNNTPATTNATLKKDTAHLHIRILVLCSSSL